MAPVYKKLAPEAFQNQVGLWHSTSVAVALNKQHSLKTRWNPKECSWVEAADLADVVNPCAYLQWLLHLASFKNTAPFFLFQLMVELCPELCPSKGLRENTVNKMFLLFKDILTLAEPIISLTSSHKCCMFHRKIRAFLLFLRAAFIQSPVQLWLVGFQVAHFQSQVPVVYFTSRWKMNTWAQTVGLDPRTVGLSLV